MDNTIQDISTVNYLKDEDVVFEKQASEDMTEAPAAEPENEPAEEPSFEKKEPDTADSAAYVPSEFISDSDFEEF